MSNTPIYSKDPTINTLLTDFTSFDVQHVQKKDKTGGILQPGNGQPVNTQPRTNVENRQNNNVVLPKRPDVKSMETSLQQYKEQVTAMKPSEPMSPVLGTKLVNLMEDAKALIQSKLKDKPGYQNISQALKPENRQAMLDLLPAGPARAELEKLLTLCEQCGTTMREGLAKAASNIINPAQAPKLQNLDTFVTESRKTLQDIGDTRDITPDQASKLMNLAEATKVQVARIFKGIDGYKDMSLEELTRLEQSLPLSKLSPAERQQVVELRELRAQCLSKLYGAKGTVRPSDLKQAQEYSRLIRNGTADSIIVALPNLITKKSPKEFDKFFVDEAMRYNKTQPDKTKHVTPEQLRTEFNNHLKPLNDIILAIKDGKTLSEQDKNKFTCSELGKLTLSSGFSMHIKSEKYVYQLPKYVEFIADLNRINSMLHSDGMEKINLALAYMPAVLSELHGFLSDAPDHFFNGPGNPFKIKPEDIGFTELQKLPAFQSLSTGKLLPADKQRLVAELRQQLTHLIRFNPTAGLSLGLGLQNLDTLLQPLTLSALDKTALTTEIRNIVKSLLVHSEDVVQGGQVGQGGYATVFSITYQGQEVIGKVIDNTKNNLFLEALALKSLPKHPNLSGFVGIIPQTGTNPSVMLMDKVPGPDLSKMMTDMVTVKENTTRVAKPVPPSSTLLRDLPFENKAKICTHLFKGALKGLNVMHGMGLAHLDIKPHNLVLNSHTLEAQIIDYGATRAMELGQSPSGGTGSYRPKDSDEPIGLFRDIYSLGVALGDLVFGDINKRYVDLGDQSEWLPLADDPFWDMPEVKPIKAFILLCTDLVPANRPTTEQMVQIMEGKPVTLAKEGENGIKTQAQIDTLKTVLAPGGMFDGGREILAGKLSVDPENMYDQGYNSLD